MKIKISTSFLFLFLLSGLLILFSFPVLGNDYKFETGIPGIVGPGQSLQALSLNDFIVKLIKILFPLAGILAFAMIVFAGFKYATSGGNTNQQKDAQDRITNALIGLVLLFAFWIIIYTINPDILKTKIPTLEPVTSPSISIPSTGVTLAQLIATAKSFANPDSTIEIKIFTSPGAPHEKYCLITTRTEGRTSTKTIPFQDCLNTYPYINNYWNAFPDSYKNPTYSYGMSCDIYVATVLRTAGIDPNYPYTNVPNQYNYTKDHPEKYQCIVGNNASLNQSQTQNGSILFYDLNHNGSPDHTALWIDNQRWQASKDDFLPMNRGFYFSGSDLPIIAICNYKGF